MDVADARPGQVSAYLDHLPAVFREAPGDGSGFLGRFLLAFEHLLTGVGDAGEPGLDELLDRLPHHFDPARAPAPFLDWLAGWVALTLRPDLDARAEGGAAGAARGDRTTARTLIAGAMSLYRVRGTRRGLEELIRLLTGGLSPTITEFAAPSPDASPSTSFDAPPVEGEAPHFFHVLLRLPHPDLQERLRAEELVRSIVDVEKPAHTRYQLDVVVPALQVGVQSRVGADTLLAPAATPGASS